MPKSPATCALAGCDLVAPARRKFCSAGHAKQGLHALRSERGRQLSMLGRAKMRELRTEDPSFDRARVSKTIATRNARDPAWRARFGQVARASQGKIHQTMSRRLGPKWRSKIAKRARPITGPKSAAARQAMVEGQRRRDERDGTEVRWLALQLRFAKTQTDLLILEDSLKTDAARKLLRHDQGKHAGALKQGRRPGPPIAYTLADIRAHVDQGKKARQLASVLGMTDQHARRLIDLVEEKRTWHPLRGEGNPRARLTSVQVGEIRSQYAAGDGGLYILAGRFGVTPGAIWRVVTGRTWSPS